MIDKQQHETSIRFSTPFFFTSCASTIGTVGLENKIKNLSIDMSKEEAFKVVGKTIK